jgi:N-acetylmuramoyl-L-alanine amidase
VSEPSLPTPPRRRRRRRPVRAGAAGIALVALLATGVAESGDHRVAAGETLSGIAARYGVSTRDLAAANGITNPNLIVAGTSLIIPGSSSAAAPATPTNHRVAVGETLSGIASRYGITTRALAEANGITDHNLIVVGATLQVAGGTGATSSGSGSSGSGSSVASASSGSSGSAAASAPAVPSFVPPSRRALAASFARWGAEYGVPTDLLMALAWQESGWQPGAVSVAQATGVMQVTPATAHFTSVVLLDLDDALPLTDPDANIRMGARFLAHLFDAFDGDEVLALAAYNQGLTSVRRRGPQDAILAYVDDILALRDRF